MTDVHQAGWRRPSCVFETASPGPSNRGKSRPGVPHPRAQDRHAATRQGSLTLKNPVQTAMGEPFAPTCAEVIDLIGKFYEIELDLPNPHNLTGVEQETALARILAARTSVLVWSRGRPGHDNVSSTHGHAAGVLRHGLSPHAERDTLFCLRHSDGRRLTRRHHNRTMRPRWPCVCEYSR